MRAISAAQTSEKNNGLSQGAELRYYNYATLNDGKCFRSEWKNGNKSSLFLSLCSGACAWQMRERVHAHDFPRHLLFTIIGVLPQNSTTNIRFYYFFNSCRTLKLWSRFNFVFWQMHKISSAYKDRKLFNLLFPLDIGTRHDHMHDPLLRSRTFRSHSCGFFPAQ